MWWGVHKPNPVDESTFLSDAELREMPTDKLYWLFKKTRSTESFIHHYYGARCCEFCHEYLGDDWQNDVGIYAEPYTRYKERIRKELRTRPDQFTWNKKKKKNQKKPQYVNRKR